MHVERITAILAFAGSSLVAGAVAAHAGSVTGSVGDCGTHSGYHFYNQAYAWNYAGSNDAAEIQTYVGSGNAPPGYIGSEVQLIRVSSGAVVRKAGMSFNVGAANGYFSSTYWTASLGAGNYQSKGKSAAFNSGLGTYSYYGAITSPAIYMAG